MTSIEVSVRVRPFNSREIKFNCELVIGMPNQTTCEIKTTTAGAPKKFNFDHCLWTFRSEDTDDEEKKQLQQAGPDVVFADQLNTYLAVGQRILMNALQGFNACLFAYGQTGSGKTYSMMGTGSDPGIIPRLAQDLFQQERNSSGADAFTLGVEVTYLEIYNESVKDLLNAKGMDKALRVRQHPKFGVYVEGLTKWTVNTEAEILKLLEDGASVRSVAATKMNATSSRSHAILTLHIKKKTQSSELVSQLHLVDLAGSERASSTGAEGDTLMEGANINKSLTTLGMCLSRLAEVSGGGAKGHVPYRDSQLTWLLNDSLGGNSKTAMLANISPASINAEETLSTLRFASTVKKIKNNAVINEDPQQRLIRELREEIAEIKKKIVALEMGLGPEAALEEDVEVYEEKAPLAEDGGALGHTATDAEEVAHPISEAAPTAQPLPPRSDAIVLSDNEADDVVAAGTVLPAASTTATVSTGTEDHHAVAVDVGVGSDVVEATTCVESGTGDVEDVPQHGDGDVDSVSSKTASNDGDGGSSSSAFEGYSDDERAHTLAHHANTASMQLAAGDGKPPRARKDSRRVQLQVPPQEETHEDLLDRLEEDATLMMQMIETDEDKMMRTQAQAVDNQQAIADLKELQVSVKLTCPRLVTLNEDLHALPSLALLYYLREGDMWLGSGAGETDNGDEDALELTASEMLSTIDVPLAGCRQTERILRKHLCFHVDGLRQEVKLTVPASTDLSNTTTTTKPARVYVNGTHVEAGTQRVLKHTDRIVVGLVAFRHSQPIRWTNETLKDDFIRPPGSLQHAEDVEAYSRIECEWAAQQELRQLLKSVAASSEEFAARMAAWQQTTAEHNNALTGALATLEETLVDRYPLTQAFLMDAALAAEAASSSTATLYDYDYAMQEIRSVADAQRREREAKHQETLKSLRQAEVDREAQIIALREELQRQEAAKQHVAMERLDAAEADARDDIEGDLYDALKDMVELWKAERLATRKRLEDRLRSELEQRKGLLRDEVDARRQLDAEAANDWGRVAALESTARAVIRDEEQRLREIDARRRQEDEERERQAQAAAAAAAAVAAAAATAVEEANAAAAAQAASSNTPPVASLDESTDAPGAHHESPFSPTPSEDASTPPPVAPTPTRADGRSRRLSMRASLPASRHVDVMVQLASDVRQYEEACREATLWKPNGPTKQEDTEEYLFSMDAPTVQDVIGFSPKATSGSGLDGVLLAQDVHKLKRGFLGRLSYHKVHVLVRERFLYYFNGSEANAKALGAAYLFGAGIERSDNAVEGKKFTLRIVPSVPRKPTKSSRGSTDENNVVFAFDTDHECDSMAALIRRLATPECPLNVKQFYAQQQSQLAGN